MTYDAFFPLCLEYGSPFDGAAGAFRTTTWDGFSTDFNPALLTHSPKFSFTNSNQKYKVMDWWFNHGCYGITSKIKNIGVGIGYRFFELNETDWAKGSSYIASLGFGYKLKSNTSIGINIKNIIDQFFYNDNLLAIDFGWHKEIKDFRYSYSSDKYLDKLIEKIPIFQFFTKPANQFSPLALGFSIRNMGSTNKFYSNEYSRITNSAHLPQSIHFGINYTPIDLKIFTFQIGAEFEKDLVAAYPDMDWDNNGYIGGYDKKGIRSKNGYYNESGQIEISHRDQWYNSLITSWGDDWFLGGNIDRGWESDGVIGGYDWIDSNNNGEVDDGEIIEAGISSNDDIEFGDENWGNFNERGDLEVGNQKGTIKDELNTFINHYGINISILDLLNIRFGLKSQKQYDFKIDTFGYSIGPRFLKYHYSKITNPGRFFVWDEQEFHSIEFIYTSEFKKIIMGK